MSRKAIATTDRWSRVQTIFEEIVDLSATERQPALETACADDPTLRSAVERLLGADDAAERRGFLAGVPDLGPVLDNAEHELQHAPEPSAATPQPESLGAYRVLREIGRGGMGTIYAAIRADRTLDREVAIKVIRTGAESADVVRRMWTECRILARLEHPCIARIHDAGSTDAGLPYFVMELVEGEPIDVYCAQRNLDLRARLHLIRQVCAAVEYANARLIVHRDIKPSNILVTPDGKPKLLDFGIAKVLDAAAEPGSEPRTEPWRQRLTLEYASPEQLRGQPVSLACDVYSLGVLLFLLLTGETPRSAHDLSPWLFDELLRSSEPPLPSQVVAERLEKENSGRGSDQAHSPRPAPAHQLRGDIDSMVLGALQADTRARYGSAQELGDDIDRYLRGFPVRARHGNLAYRAGKFLRRHHRALAASTLILALVAALLTSRIQAGAQAQEAAAQLYAENVRRQHVLNTFLEIFEQAGPFVAEGMPLTLRQAVDRYMERSADRFDDQPDVQASILSTLGWIYLDLGDPTKAGKFHRRALELRQALGPTGPKQIESLVGVAAALREQGRLDEAEPLSLEALRLIQIVPDLTPHARLRALNHHVNLKCFQEDWQAADPVSLEALELAAKLQETPSAEVSIASSQRAQVLRRLGDFEAARQLYSQTIETVKKRSGPEHPVLATLHNNLAELAYRADDHETAIADWIRVDEHYRRVYGDDYYGRITPLNNRARALLALGRQAEAEALLRQALWVSQASPALKPRHEARYFGRVAIKLSELLSAANRCTEVTELLAGRSERWKDGKTKRKAEELLRRCRDSSEP